MNFCFGGIWISLFYLMLNNEAILDIDLADETINPYLTGIPALCSDDKSEKSNCMKLLLLINYRRQSEESLFNSNSLCLTCSYIWSCFAIIKRNWVCFFSRKKRWICNTKLHKTMSFTLFRKCEIYRIGLWSLRVHSF